MTSLKSSQSANAAGRIDPWLLTATLLLAGFGLIMVLSSSGIMAERIYADKYYFFKRQLAFTGVGLVAMFLCMQVPRRLLYSLTYVWVGLAVVLLALCSSPLGATVNGAHRWIKVGPVNVQPLEYAKVALVFYLAYFFAHKQAMVRTFSVGFLPPFFVTGLLCGLLLLQPDFGGAVVLSGLLFLMCLVGGTRFSYLFLSLIFASGAGWLLISSSPYRFKRWTAFLDPFASAQNEGYQLVQSLYAFGSGKIFGSGIGAGQRKLFFLPEAHNDFIMAVVGEELGFVGMSLFFLGISFFLFRSFNIALKLEDLQDRFTAFGVTCILALGIILNLAVVLGTVPPKGVAMPFISYGGSSLTVSFICAGILLNLSRRVKT
ncbi:MULTISPECIES: putative lipid II flippase FtsW [unclassified Pseudodesulfovibrio]|uniref:putative lipid II flippase FtsW n=1 Tax=unclassified Pseudodesulfovibrio TaxID=2661612 RepID=UPI000FEB6723|nr:MULTISPECIES: putative lipid II flippase FtsW [unclassified Pseudodesulfovibrio]MCJ2164901.1 putative lipid II flippase FtsW [Pseudodesulfovibrio sp. S3-i]RWU03735.1 putative lipid II flippase FtsW [Pseudodesulfovibrio sp. S3]